MSSRLTDAIDDLLPQTQCRRCGYPSCRDYADALARGHTEINRCPPGGETTIDELAKLLEVPVIPLDPSCGAAGPLTVALIDERWCIGCTICLKVCPVDAIVGAAKLMHTVLAVECTGCELCVQPCPTDCIEMREVAWHPQRDQLGSEWTTTRANLARRRFRDRHDRLMPLKEERSAQAARASLRRASQAAKKRAIDAAVARVRGSQRAVTPEGNDESNKTG